MHSNVTLLISYISYGYENRGSGRFIFIQRRMDISCLLLYVVLGESIQ